MDHHPVLLNEVLASLALRPNAVIVDATVNRGGHAEVIGAHLGPEGVLVGIDADSQALAEAEINLQHLTCRRVLLLGNFRDLDRLLTRAGIEEVDAVLFDLGTSTQQLFTADRGFSFQRPGPLQMTFTTTVAVGQLTAEKIVNAWSEDELVEILADYGEERFARTIAKALVAARRVQPITTTQELAEIVKQAVPSWYQHRRLHPATKTFQALRIVVNDELNALAEGLRSAWSRLRPGGRLAVITFHSLEARAVKTIFREWLANSTGQLITRHVIKPTREEIVAYPASRSSQLRIIKKL